MRFLYKTLPYMAIITVFSILIYSAVQQSYRQSLNDPQIAIVEDASTALSRGVPIDTVVPPAAIDIASSLSSWVAVYGASGTPILSSGKLNGALPRLPAGVFADLSGADHYQSKLLQASKITDGVERITWQPQNGVRQATVIAAYSSPTGNGFVVAGRNMREVEYRENQLFDLVAVCWVFLMLATALWAYIEPWFGR